MTELFGFDEPCCRYIIYSELYSKANEREERENRRKKKARDEFMSFLKRSDQITDATPWDEAKNLFGDRFDIKAIATPIFLLIISAPQYEEEYKDVLQEYIAKQRRKEEKRKKRVCGVLGRTCLSRCLKEAAESSSGDDHRHRRSHRRRKKHASSDSDEGAPERKSRSKRYVQMEISIFTTLSTTRHFSDEEGDVEKSRKKHKKDKHKERKRERHHDRDKSKSKHEGSRKK